MLDFQFRIEKQFGIRVERGDYRILERWALERRGHLKPPYDLAAGELHDWVVQLCEARGVKVPWSSWNRVRLELAKVVRKPPQIIHHETLIIRDLGFS